MAVLRRSTWLIALLAFGACASPGLREDYGEGALKTEHFDMLDSAIMSHAGAAVTVVTQKDVGAGTPSRSTRQEQVWFPGTLIPPTDEFLRLVQHGTDTLRIGKGSVVGMYLEGEHHEASTAAVLVGALVLGVGAAFVSGDARGDVSTGTKLAIIPAAALLGALIGAIVVPQEDRGERIYPPLPPPKPGESK